MPYKDKIKRAICNKECLKRYYQRNKIKILEHYKSSLIERPWLRLIRNIKSRCYNKSHHYYKMGIKYLITPSELKSIWFRDRAYDLIKPSIDRINGCENYTKENCRIIELSDNLKRRKQWRTPALTG